MKQDKKKQTLISNPKHPNRQGTKTAIIQKLPEEMEAEIRDCFNLYDTNRSGYISREHMRSILGNFGFINKTVKDIEEDIKDEVKDESKSTFSFNDIVDLITKKWFYGKGRDEEIDEIYELFVRKDKKVGINEIKNAFSQYLDIPISDADILEFIQDADQDGDGLLTKQEIASKMGYL